MFRSMLAVAVAALAFTSFAVKAADEENPYKKAKVGDWAEYSTHVEMQGGVKMDSKMKQTVSAVSEKEVTIKMEMEVAGNKNEQEMKVDLTKKYEASTAGMPPNMKADVVKGKEGDETIKAGGKEYNAHFVENKVTVDMGGAKMTTESKVWISKEVPLGGLVKMENKMANGMNMTMELTGTGTK